MKNPEFDFDTNKVATFLKKAVLIIIGLAIIVGVTLVGLMIFFLSPVNSNYDGYTYFEVEQGWGSSRIGAELHEAGLIRSNFFFRAYMRINNQTLLAGTYRLSKSMSTYEIVRKINSGNSLEAATITVRFNEGTRLTNHVAVITNYFDFEAEEILARLADEEFLAELIDRYWFLTEDILAEGIKYPLEGYLFPDTYNLRISASIDDIIHVMLRTMEQRLELLRADIELSNLSVHEIITMASLIETEGRLPEDRKIIASAIFNRLNRGMQLGLCVTIRYAAGTTPQDPITISQINACSPFNTRSQCGAPGLPIGPIASPSMTSIIAVIEPATTDYLFWVNDTTMTLHFSRTYQEHNRTIRELRAQGIWQY